jgi:hypothetical protein
MLSPGILKEFKMFHQKVKFYSCFLALALILAACGGNSNESDQATSATQDQPAATTAPATQAETTASSETTAPAAASDSSNSGSVTDQMVAIEDASGINSYRMQMHLTMKSDEEDVTIDVTGEFVKEPRAERLTMRINEVGGEENQEVSMVLVDGIHYIQAAGFWMQTPDASLTLDEMTPFNPADFAKATGDLKRVGEETINGRATVHYQADENLLAAALANQDGFDFSQAEDFQVDLWLDKAEQFVVKMETSGTDNEGGIFSMVVEYVDFNQPITITAPEVGMLTIPSDDEGEDGAAVPLVPAGSNGSADLSGLVGFELALPEGSTITLMMPNMVQATVPYALDESVNLFQQEMLVNGYSLVSQMAPEEGQTMLIYEKDEKFVTINLSAVDDNQTQWSIAAG